MAQANVGRVVAEGWCNVQEKYRLAELSGKRVWHAPDVWTLGRRPGRVLCARTVRLLRRSAEFAIEQRDQWVIKADQWALEADRAEETVKWAKVRATLRAQAKRRASC